MKTKISKRW